MEKAIQLCSYLSQLFDNKNALSNLENFVSINGANHYKLQANNETILMTKSQEPIPLKDYLYISKEKIKIFKPDFPVFWKIAK